MQHIQPHASVPLSTLLLSPLCSLQMSLATDTKDGRTQSHGNYFLLAKWKVSILHQIILNISLQIQTKIDFLVIAFLFMYTTLTDMRIVRYLRFQVDSRECDRCKQRCNSIKLYTNVTCYKHQELIFFTCEQIGCVVMSLEGVFVCVVIHMNLIHTILYHK